VFCEVPLGDVGVGVVVNWALAERTGATAIPAMAAPTNTVSTKYRLSLNISMSVQADNIQDFELRDSADSRFHRAYLLIAV
jgi:hypothetical protein